MPSFSGHSLGAYCVPGAELGAGAQTDLPTSRCGVSVFPCRGLVHVTCTHTQLSIVTAECVSHSLSPHAIWLVPGASLGNSFSECESSAPEGSALRPWGSARLLSRCSADWRGRGQQGREQSAGHPGETRREEWGGAFCVLCHLLNAPLSSPGPTPLLENTPKAEGAGLGALAGGCGENAVSCGGSVLAGEHRYGTRGQTPGCRASWGPDSRARCSERGTSRGVWSSRPGLGASGTRNTDVRPPGSGGRGALGPRRAEAGLRALPAAPWCLTLQAVPLSKPRFRLGGGAGRKRRDGECTALGEGAALGTQGLPGGRWHC